MKEHLARSAHDGAPEQSYLANGYGMLDTRSPLEAFPDEE